jgi:hypothetical protein
MDGVEDAGFSPETDGIISEAAFEQARQEMRAERLVTVATAGSPAEAHVFRGWLEAEGIPAFVSDELMSTSSWEWCSRKGVEIQVRENDAERARHIVVEMVAKTSPNPPEDLARKAPDQRFQRPDENLRESR